jgi:hypothetical protein
LYDAARTVADLMRLRHRFGEPAAHLVLAEKLTTAIELGPAPLATAAFRDTTIRSVSDAVQDLVSLRAATYNAYRRGLGPDATRLPEHFGQVVDAVTTFADPLIKGADPYDAWNPQHRRCERTAR